MRGAASPKERSKGAVYVCDAASQKEHVCLRSAKFEAATSEPTKRPVKTSDTSSSQSTVPGDFDRHKMPWPCCGSTLARPLPEPAEGPAAGALAGGGATPSLGVGRKNLIRGAITYCGVGRGDAEARVVHGPVPPVASVPSAK